MFSMDVALVLWRERERERPNQQLQTTKSIGEAGEARQLSFCLLDMSDPVQDVAVVAVEKGLGFVHLLLMKFINIFKEIAAT